MVKQLNVSATMLPTVCPGLSTNKTFLTVSSSMGSGFKFSGKVPSSSSSDSSVNKRSKQTVG
jgi:hypothetical protein